MPQKRGNGNENNGASRGQAPGNHGRGRGGSHNSKFADYSQSMTIGINDSDDFMVLDFNNMGALSGLTNGHSNKPRGRGRGGFNVNAPDFLPQRGGPPPSRGRGGGRGGYVPIPVVVTPYDAPKRGNAVQTSPSRFRGRGGGLGYITSPEHLTVKNWDLSTRPLLRPIKFVRAKERLFEADPEELLQAHKVPPHPSDQLDPQTDRLAAVFGQEGPSAFTSTANTSGQETPLRIQDDKEQETTVSIASISVPQTQTSDKQIMNGQNLLSILTASMEVQAGTTATTETLHEATSDLFFIDTTGQTAQESQLQVPLFEPAVSALLGEHEPDEIILVPSPITRKTPASTTLELKEEVKVLDSHEASIPIVTMENLSLDFTKMETDKGENKSLLSFSVPKTGRSAKVPLRARKEARKRKQGAKFTEDLGTIFGFKDGREGLRKGDSDLNVGSESSEEIEDNGMDVDADLDAAAMARFARGVGAQHMSMADVEIEAAFQAGDMDSDSNEEDDDDEPEEGELEMNEAIVIQDDDEDDDWSSDENEDVDMTPTTSFKNRLKRVRERTPGFTDADIEIDDTERTWADRDEDYLTQLSIILDENAGILSSRDRKAKNALFKTLSKADPDYPFAVSSHQRNEQGKDVYDFLAEQWQRDRNKKSERKRAREALRAVQGGLGNGNVKGKGKNRHVDLEEIEQMMRDLLTAVGPGARNSFELPPMDKPMRVKVHVMAQVFHLKSTSFGSKNKESKSMTISRTKNTGIRPVNEYKLNATMKRKGNGGADLRGIREGEIIGHQAAKISEDNRGYRLLAAMGWSEGDRIGKEGGLDAPLIAVMKKSKLGLGHSASRLQ